MLKFIKPQMSLACYITFLTVLENLKLFKCKKQWNKIRQRVAVFAFFGRTSAKLREVLSATLPLSLMQFQKM